MATTGVFNFRRLKVGCDPANVFECYEQDTHTLEVHNARLLPQDTDILLPSSAGLTVVSHVSSITDCRTRSYWRRPITMRCSLC